MSTTQSSCTFQCSVVVELIKKKIGSDLSVIAYDDHEAFELHTPGISTVQQPLEEIAETVIKLILNQLSSKSKLPNQQVIIPAKLIIRN